jgi:hypothetical protein
MCMCDLPAVAAVAARSWLVCHNALNFGGQLITQHVREECDCSLLPVAVAASWLHARVMAVLETIGRQ